MLKKAVYYYDLVQTMLYLQKGWDIATWKAPDGVRQVEYKKISSHHPKSGYFFGETVEARLWCDLRRFLEIVSQSSIFPILFRNIEYGTTSPSMQDTVYTTTSHLPILIYHFLLLTKNEVVIQREKTLLSEGIKTIQHCILTAECDIKNMQERISSVECTREKYLLSQSILYSKEKIEYWNDKIELFTVLHEYTLENQANLLTFIQKTNFSINRAEDKKEAAKQQFSELMCKIISEKLPIMHPNSSVEILLSVFSDKKENFMKLCPKSGSFVRELQENIQCDFVWDRRRLQKRAEALKLPQFYESLDEVLTEYRENSDLILDRYYEFKLLQKLFDYWNIIKDEKPVLHNRATIFHDMHRGIVFCIAHLLGFSANYDNLNDFEAIYLISGIKEPYDQWCSEMYKKIIALNYGLAVNPVYMSLFKTEFTGGWHVISYIDKQLDQQKVFSSDFTKDLEGIRTFLLRHALLNQCSVLDYGRLFDELISYINELDGKHHLLDIFMPVINEGKKLLMDWFVLATSAQAKYKDSSAKITILDKELFEFYRISGGRAPWTILGIDKDSTNKVVRGAFTSMVQQYSAAVGLNAITADVDAFQLIVAARNIMQNPAKRQYAMQKTAQEITTLFEQTKGRVLALTFKPDEQSKYKLLLLDKLYDLCLSWSSTSAISNFFNIKNSFIKNLQTLLEPSRAVDFYTKDNIDGLFENVVRYLNKENYPEHASRHFLKTLISIKAEMFAYCDRRGQGLKDSVESDALPMLMSP